MYAGRRGEDGLEADGAADGAEAAGRLGGAGAGDRYRVRAAQATPARQLRNPPSRAVRGHRVRSLGGVGPDRATVAHVVERWVASKIDVSTKTKLQYEWAAGHIRAGLGGVRLDRLERHDVARWLESLAQEGKFSRRSIQIMRTALRAALEDAVDLGELRRSPAARVGMPRNVAGRSRQPLAVAWTEDELRRFLAGIAEHRWCGPLRLSALYGLRRSELLGLTWSNVDLNGATVRISQALIEVHGRPEWSEGKNERSRRTIPIDPSVVASLRAHRRVQNLERLAAGAGWEDHDLVVATQIGRPVSPGNFDQTLDRLVGGGGRAPPDLARAAAHGRDAHGPPRGRHR